MDGTNIQELRQRLKTHVKNDLFKEATLGGSQEGGFEQAFSSLAYAYLKDKAPRLLDSLVGFQLVDRNEDNTKAMGVFGFKVGEQWIYAPVFFLNGDLKGHELLYVKKSDSFVPMKENWVNYILSRKPHVLGESSPQETNELGGLVPDITSIRATPGAGKYGSDRMSPEISEWSTPFLSVVAAAKLKSDKIFRKHAELGQRLSLKEFLSQDITLAKGAFELARKYPTIKKSFDKFYGIRFLSEVGDNIKKASFNVMPKAKPKTRKKMGQFLIPEVASKPIENPLKTGALRIFIYDRVAISSGADSLEEEDREDLLRDGMLVKDHRDGEQVSVAYNTQTESKLSNPHETGIYMVLERPTEFNKMLVVGNPHSNNGRENFATVVRLGDGDKAWLNAHRTNVWSKDIDTDDNYREWWDGLSDSTKLQVGATYLALDNRGSGTVPFVVRSTLSGGKAYQVDMKDHVNWEQRRPSSLPHLDGGSESPSDRFSSYDAKLSINARNGSQLRSLAGELHVPDNFKFLKVKNPPKPSDLPCCIMGDSSGGDGSDPKPISPGNISDIQIMFTEKTARMKLYTDHDEVVIATEAGQNRMTKTSGVVALVRDHGLREKAARDMIREASRKGAQTFRVKYAQPFGPPGMDGGGMLQPGPSAPPMPPPPMGMEQVGYGAVPAQYPQEMGMPVPGMDSGQTDPSIYDPFSAPGPDPQAMQLAQEAGQNGQKEVFDTAMISGMLKAVRQDSLVDRYLGDLLNALDKLGRILFMFYWHGEEFEDRYGKQDLPEIEDSLRNAFEVLGDVVLFLKEKSIEPGLEELGEPNIEEAARN
jgi:hypothetical protein